MNYNTNKDFRKYISQVNIDSELSLESTNPVQNKVLYEAIQNVSTPSWNVLKDKPFYEEQKTRIVFDGDLQFNNSDYYNAFNEELKDENKYHVEYDGKLYECIAKTTEYGNIFLGNQEIGYSYGYIDSIDDEIEFIEPFFITTRDNGGDIESYIIIFDYDLGNHHFKISECYTDVIPLDEKYISEINWNKITNKPIYAKVNSIPSFDASINFNYYYYNYNTYFALNEGNTYFVKWDGVEYECLARNDGHGTIYIGNQQISDGWGFPEIIESNEPFFIYKNYDALCIYISNPNYETQTHNIQIFELTEKFEDKYLINADWNENDKSSAAYIVNKPFYHSPEINSTFLEVEFTEEDLQQITNYQENEYYDIYINDIERVNKIIKENGIVGINYKIVVNGETKGILQSGAYSSYFYFNGSIENYYFSFTLNNSEGSVSICLDTKEKPKTFKIERLIEPEELVQIEEKFIPDTVSRVEDLPHITPRNQFLLMDEDTGLCYFVKIKGGRLVSYCECDSISVIKMPDKTEYIQQETFDPTGIIVMATCKDGTTRQVTNLTYSGDMVTLGTSSINIKYTENNKEFNTFVDIEITPNVELMLMDFDYTANNDGTYTIESWKNTLNGEYSTEMVFPNHEKFILEKGEE